MLKEGIEEGEKKYRREKVRDKERRPKQETLTATK